MSQAISFSVPDDFASYLTCLSDMNGKTVSGMACYLLALGVVALDLSDFDEDASRDEIMQLVRKLKFYAVSFSDLTG